MRLKHTPRATLLALLLPGCTLEGLPLADYSDFTEDQGRDETVFGSSSLRGADGTEFLGLTGDEDGDGVSTSFDCDDSDPRLGRLLYESDLSADDGELVNSPTLTDPWSWDGNSARASRGGQQALLGQDGGWSNVVVFADLSAAGTEIGCGFDCFEECREYVPEDCYTEAEALGLGLLSAAVTSSGVLTLSNSGEYDVCLNSWSMWYNPASQAVSLGDMGETGEEVRVPAGSSISTYYGSWTTDNGYFERYLGEDAFWCNQLGTTMVTGMEYSTDGAVMPEDMAWFVQNETDEDGDGVEDHVDWATSYGIQTQYNIWDYQSSHAAVSVGKLASASEAGVVEVILALHNRGAVNASDVELTDTIPRNWTLVGCDVAPDSETYNADDTTTLTWTASLDGCTSSCSVVDELVITCELTNALGVDVSNVLLPSASVAYFDGEDDEVSASRGAFAFDYDHDGDGEILCGATSRWRGGVLLRAQEDEDQGEGFHGYRCALAQNSPRDCFDDGHFLQIGEFMDIEEDDIESECTTGCPTNNSFDQLGRANHDGVVDISAGDPASLTFWAYGDDLYCEAADESGAVFSSLSATDDSLHSGGVGLSTLNLYGDYDHIRVCAALSAP